MSRKPLFLSSFKNLLVRLSPIFFGVILAILIYFSLILLAHLIANLQGVNLLSLYDSGDDIVEWRRSYEELCKSGFSLSDIRVFYIVLTWAGEPSKLGWLPIAFTGGLIGLMNMISVPKRRIIGVAAIVILIIASIAISIVTLLMICTLD